MYGKDFAEVYNVAWKGFSERFAPVLHGLLADAPGRSLVDLCCGTGQLSRYFLDHGWTALGVDLSADMLRHAEANNRVHLESGAFRTERADAARFRVAAPVAAVVSLFDALNHLPDEAALASCLASAKAALVDGGYLVFDLNTEKGLRNWTFLDVEDEPGRFMVKRGLYVEKERKAWMEVVGFREALPGKWVRFDEQFPNTWFPAPLVRSLLGRAGFRDVECRRADAAFGLIEDPELETRAFWVARA